MLLLSTRKVPFSPDPITTSVALSFYLYLRPSHQSCSLEVLHALAVKLYTECTQFDQLSRIRKFLFQLYQLHYLLLSFRIHATKHFSSGPATIRARCNRHLIATANLRLCALLSSFTSHVPSSTHLEKDLFSVTSQSFLASVASFLRVFVPDYNA